MTDDRHDDTGPDSVRPLAVSSDGIGLRDGPFRCVETFGELEPAVQHEWLHTNGAGAYAMSTVALMHTRRSHGILVAALNPPLDRYVMLSHGEMVLATAGKTYRLSTHQFPSIAPTPGYRNLRRFCQDPLPHWYYDLGGTRFERRIALVRGWNAVTLSYTWYGAEPAMLGVRPLMPFRSIHGLMREHGAMVQRVNLRQGEVEVQPMAHLPPMIFRHAGVFVGSPDWWRRFEYTHERESGADFVEDMWTPGTFDLELQPGVPVYLLAGAGVLPDRSPEDLLRDTERYELAQDPGPGRPAAVRALSVAAEQFCAVDCARPSVMAGFPLLDVITRDALVALPGLLLARDRIPAAKAVLDTLVGSQRDGMLPFRLPSAEAGPLPSAPDATLWLFNAVRELVDRVGPADDFVRHRLYPALLRAFARLRRGRRYGVWMTDDGLLANWFEGIPLTWMDARVGDRIVTPRRGLAIEYQALWTRAADLLAQLATSYGHRSLSATAEGTARRARAAFRERFWCNETEYPFDCISEGRGTADAWADASIRPNALVALALDPELFDGWQSAAIVGRARDDLLTPRGLRSLAPAEPGYRGHYEGRAAERDSSYHQGTAWTHLLGCFVRAALRLSPHDVELRRELSACIDAGLGDGPVLGQVAQLADGDPPHRFRGSPAQAWAVGELLRTLVVDLGV
ncbi:MAG: glycogen debranching enzyme N-terminal domain-containing protein [Polyangiaceae bacterium]|nr:glycogen debranching enzyme N-terminal domain-containing protein [Polyangiaceae bacterium]